MGFNFLDCERDQDYLMPPSVADWLPEDHLAWFVVDTVGQLDLSKFLAGYRADGWGRAAHDPAMMVALLVYAYCLGVRSARKIESRCREDVGFRVVAANAVPDHATIARFRARHEDALAGLFTQSLQLCQRAGLVKLGVVALDGTKMGAPAALAANRTAEQIDAELTRIGAAALAEAAATDAAEDALFGPARGDEVPAGLRGRAARQARLVEAKKRLDGEAAARAAAHEQHLAARAATEAATGRKLAGRKPKPPPPAAGAQANVSDPDSRIMKTREGYLQGYNAQAVVTVEQVVLAAEVTDAAADVAQLHPMIEAMTTSLTAAQITQTPATLVADTGYWSEANATAAAGPDYTGPQLLIATVKDWKQRRAAQQAGLTAGPPPAEASALEQMEHRLRTAEGRELYAQRGQSVEPVFGQHKDGRGFRRFCRRGKTAAAAEWKMINATHNLLKLFRRTRPTSTAPATPCPS